MNGRAGLKWDRCIDFAKDFIVSGTASDQLFGTCESLWEPDLEPEDLFETCSQALLNAVDRDALSGVSTCGRSWGGVSANEVRLGCTCLHHHEGQDNQEITQGYGDPGHKISHVLTMG